VAGFLGNQFAGLERSGCHGLTGAAVCFDPARNQQGLLLRNLALEQLERVVSFSQSRETPNFEAMLEAVSRAWRRSFATYGARPADAG
jgi:hypothetical protein